METTRYHLPALQIEFHVEDFTRSRINGNVILSVARATKHLKSKTSPEVELMETGDLKADLCSVVVSKTSPEVELMETSVED